jgi:hypothetical protein
LAEESQMTARASLLAPMAALLLLQARAPAQLVENAGQLDPAARFLARTGRLTVFLTDGGFVAQLVEPGAEDVPRRGANVFFDVEGAAACRPRGTRALPGRFHYLLGPDPARWVVDVPSWSRVRMPGPSRAVALEFHQDAGPVEYDVLLSDGALPDDVVIAVRGARALWVDASGALVADTAAGAIRQEIPAAFRVLPDGRRERIACGFRLLDSNRFTFDAPPEARGATLVIDPILTYAGYLGGSSLDEVHEVAVDPSGSVYLAGNTSSTNFPTTPGSYDVTFSGSSDGFVSKLDASGTGLVYSTLIGGTGSDFVHAMVVNASGQVTMTGKCGVAFPVTTGAYDTTQNGWKDAFVTRLNAAGNGLVFSTYLGGDNEDFGNAIAIDASGNLYVAGQMKSTNFPSTPGVYDTSANGYWEAFVAKLNPTAQTLLFSTFIGGSGLDWGRALAVASDGSIFLAGSSDSANFPTTSGAFDPSPNGSVDVFVARLNANGTALLAATVLGSAGLDHGMDVVLDASNAPLVTGVALPGFPATAGAFDATNDNGDAFVAKLSPDLATLVFSTFVGGMSTEQGTAIGLDATGAVYVGGFTNSANFPVTPGAAIPTFGGGGAPGDGFLFKLRGDGSKLDYATYVGGSGHEEVLGLALRAPGSVLVVGTSSSTNLPVSSGALATPGGADNGFFFRFDVPLAATAVLGPGWSHAGAPATLALSGPPVIGQSVTLSVGGAPPATTGVLYASAPAPETSYGGVVPVYLGLPDIAPVVTFVTTSSGDAAILLPVPPDPLFAGVALHAQAVLLTGTGPFGFAVSGGVAVTAGY